MNSNQVPRLAVIGCLVVVAALMQLVHVSSWFKMRLTRRAKAYLIHMLNHAKAVLRLSTPEELIHFAPNKPLEGQPPLLCPYCHGDPPIFTQSFADTGYRPQTCMWCWRVSVQDTAPAIPLPNGPLH